MKSKVTSFDLTITRDEKSQETRNKLLKTAGDLLRNYQFSVATVRNICKVSGVSYGSFYHFFGSKDNLLYQYVLDLFNKNLKNNPIPDNIHQDDFMKQIAWYLMILCGVCEGCGRDIMKYIYQSVKNDIFADTYQNQITDLLKFADENGYLGVKRGRREVYFIQKDLQIICRGVILWWCTEDDNSEPLGQTMDHLTFRFIRSAVTEKYERLNLKHSMVSNGNTYLKYIHLVDLPTDFQFDPEHGYDNREID